jgi:hypothetical protein
MADDRYETLLANYRNAWAGLRMIREAVETLGPPGALPSGEAVISLMGLSRSTRRKRLWTPWRPSWGMIQIQGRQSSDLVNGQVYASRNPTGRTKKPGEGVR